MQALVWTDAHAGAGDVFVRVGPVCETPSMATASGSTTLPAYAINGINAAGMVENDLHSTASRAF